MLDKKKRKYFKYDGEKSSSFNKSVFLVRWVEDEVTKKINSEGPFQDSNDAKKRCLHLLKSGVCAWLVKYSNE
tara:strand:+ start:683 stop:901 length:219 start_codon:yes stop_codon:yes gene_type:complete